MYCVLVCVARVYRHNLATQQIKLWKWSNRDQHIGDAEAEAAKKIGSKDETER